MENNIQMVDKKFGYYQIKNESLIFKKMADEFLASFF